MPIAVTWNSPEKNIILITFDRPWTWEDFDGAFVQMNDMFKSISHNTSVILNISKGGFPPPNAVQHFRRVSENQHSNLDKIVVVGIPTFFRAMLTLLRSVYQGRYEEPTFLFAPTLEATHQLIANGILNDK